jgi:hypothetical protein
MILICIKTRFNGEQMRTDHPSSTVLHFRTPAMLAIVAVLQVLDWHSTLTAPPYRHETNRLLNWLGGWVSFAFAVSAIKLAFLVMLAAGFLFWRKHRDMYELEFGLCLGVLTIAYGCVVANNYCA